MISKHMYKISNYLGNQFQCRLIGKNEVPIRIALKR